MTSLLLLTSCNRLAKTHECRRLGAIVNAGLGKVEASLHKGSAAEYRALGPLYKALAAEVRQARLSSSAGTALVSEFATLFESTASATTNFGAALEAQDTRKIEEARRDLERLARHEQGLAMRLDSYCEAP
jgi:hypothetical protein